jgi:hypothetical protein
MTDADQAYLEEQARLQADLDGEAPDDLKIEIPKDPEVNPIVYRDVESLLYRGFIHIAADINGVPFVLKSLNQHEYDLLQMVSGPRKTTRDTWKRHYSIFLAYGVFMIDGINILSDRDHWIQAIADRFDKLSIPARNKLVWNLSEINRRASAAVLLTEAYAMEMNSRFRWAQIKGLDLASPSLTGIRGTEYLGLNWAQLTWRALNTFDDTKDNIEREWENAKFIGACFAGKGLNKVYSHDNRRRREEADLRRSRKDHILRHVILGAPLDDGVDRQGDHVVIAAKTVDQLADQLTKSLKGERDWHDEVVSAIEERQQKEYQVQQDRLQQLAEENEHLFGGRRVAGSTDLAGISLDEVAKRLEARQQAAASQVRPELVDPKHAEFLDKWGMSGKGPPPMVTHANRESAKPFKR